MRQAVPNRQARWAVPSRQARRADRADRTVQTHTNPHARTHSVTQMNSCVPIIQMLKEYQGIDQHRIAVHRVKKVQKLQK